MLILWRLQKRHKKVASAPRRRRRNHRWSKDWIPWLQRKGELHAEGWGRSELEARGSQHELEAEIIYEIPTEEKRHELKSEEFAQEMEISEKVGNLGNADYAVSLVISPASPS